MSPDIFLHFRHLGLSHWAHSWSGTISPIGVSWVGVNSPHFSFLGETRWGQTILKTSTRLQNDVPSHATSLLMGWHSPVIVHLLAQCEHSTSILFVIIKVLFVVRGCEIVTLYHTYHAGSHVIRLGRVRMWVWHKQGFKSELKKHEGSNIVR